MTTYLPKAAVVVADEIVGAPSIAHRGRGNFVGKPKKATCLPLSLAGLALNSFAHCDGNGGRQILSRLVGQLPNQSFGFRIFDV
jgi:hypothetical protein